MGTVADRTLRRIPKIPTKDIDRAARKYSELNPRRKSYSSIEAYFHEKKPEPLFAAEIVIDTSELLLRYVYGRIGQDAISWSGEGFKKNGSPRPEYLLAHELRSPKEPDWIALSAIKSFGVLMLPETAVPVQRDMIAEIRRLVEADPAMYENATDFVEAAIREEIRRGRARKVNRLV